MKICNVCKIEKSASDFYKGHAKCKKCYINKVKTHRLEHIDHYREYDNKRNMLEHRVEARKKYLNTDKGKFAGKKAKLNWQTNNLIKRSAALIVGNAIRHGEIIKSEVCQGCNNKHHRIHGHHDDYAYPMIVRWLCPKCHNKWHKENGPGLNGQSDLLNNQQQSSCQL